MLKYCVKYIYLFIYTNSKLIYSMIIYDLFLTNLVLISYLTFYLRVELHNVHVFFDHNFFLGSGVSFKLLIIFYFIVSPLNFIFFEIAKELYILNIKMHFIGFLNLIYQAIFFFFLVLISYKFATEKLYDIFILIDGPISFVYKEDWSVIKQYIWKDIPNLELNDDLWLYYRSFDGSTGQSLVAIYSRLYLIIASKQFINFIYNNMYLSFT